MFLVHHCPRYLQYVPILAFGYSILLRCVSASKLSSNSFLSKVCCEGVEEVLFAVVWSKASYMTIGCLFNFVLELLEVWEHFTFLTHGINSSVPGEVVDEHFIISTATECCHLGWSPYIWIHNIQDSFAYVPLLWECVLHAWNLLLNECRETDDESFRLHSFELLDIDVTYPLVP